MYFWGFLVSKRDIHAEMHEGYENNKERRIFLYCNEYFFFTSNPPNIFLGPKTNSITVLSLQRDTAPHIFVYKQTPLGRKEVASERITCDNSIPRVTKKRSNTLNEIIDGHNLI